MPDEPQQPRPGAHAEHGGEDDQRLSQNEMNGSRGGHFDTPVAATTTLRRATPKAHSSPVRRVAEWLLHCRITLKLFAFDRAQASLLPPGTLGQVIEMAELARTESEELPAFTAELVYLRVQTEALIVVLGPKKGARLVAVMEEMFEREQEFMSAHPIRPSAWQTELRRRTQQAAVAFDALRPVFRARVPRR